MSTLVASTISLPNTIKYSVVHVDVWIEILYLYKEKSNLLEQSL